MQFIDRYQAGKKLAQALRRFKDIKGVIVLALPRGGVVLGAEVARLLRAPLDLVLVRKIGHPYNPEYAIGSVADGQEPILNPDEISEFNKGLISQKIETARLEIERKKDLYFEEGHVAPNLKDKIVLVVDDGIATGYTMKAAVSAVSAQRPKQIVIATPVASVSATELLKPADAQIVILDKPQNFLGAVGAHYLNFKEVDDNEVRTLLAEVNYDLHSTSSPAKQPAKIS